MMKIFASPRRISTILWILAGLTLAAVGVPGVRGQQTNEDRGVLANLLSRALSTPATRISIGAVEGALSSDATIRDVTVSDRDGVAMRLDRARIVWRRTALLQRRLEIERLEIDRLEVLRRPVPADEPVPGEQEPLVPELPLEVRVQAFRLGELVLGEPVLGTAARLAAEGSASLGSPTSGLTLDFRARRLDGAGTAAVRLNYRPETTELALGLLADEPEGGLIARLAALPGLPPVHLDLTGSGPLDAFGATLDFTAGPEIGAKGRAETRREPEGRRLSLDLQARIAPWLPQGPAPVFAGETRLTGGVLRRDDGAWRLDDLSVRSVAAEMRLSGAVSADGVLDMGARLRSIPGAGGVARAGEATLRSLTFDGRARGPVASPRVEGDFALRDLAFPDGRVDAVTARLSMVPAAEAGRFAVEGDVQAVGLAPRDRALARALGPRASMTLRADIGPGPANVRVLRAETATAAVDFTGWAGLRRLDGRASLRVPDLAPFSDLAGRPLGGSARIEAGLTGTPLRDRYEVALTGGIDRPTAGLPQLERAVGSTLRLEGAVVASPLSVSFRNLRLAGGDLLLRVDGRLADDAYDLNATAALADLSKADPGLKGALDGTLRLTGTPAKPVLDARAKIGAGSITLAGAAGETVDLTLGIEDLSLGASVLVAPELALQGRVDASARVTGPRDAPEGPFKFSVEGLTSAPTRSAGVGPMALRGDGRVADGRAEIKALLDAGKFGEARIDGSVPVTEAGLLDLALRARLDAAALGALVGPGRRVSGRITTDLRITGPTSNPATSGSLSLTGGSFIDPLQGLRFDAVEVRAAARGSSLVIERASATTKNGGVVSGSGSVRLDPAAGLPADLRITARRAQLVETPSYDAIADMDLTVTGPIMRAPRIAGRIGVETANIRVPERLGRTLQPLPGTKHVGAPPQTRARLARNAKSGRGPAGAFDAALDLTVDAPRRIYVRGRGLNVELGGRIRLTGRLSEPVPIGAFELRRGSLSVLSQRLDFTHGRVALTGDLVPTLDLEARTSAASTTVKVLVTGRADEPEFTVASEPELPQEEALSRLLFQRPTGNLSPFQAVQLADAAASFGGGGPLEGLRRSLGLESLDIVSGANGPGAALARTVGERARVGIETGATPATTGVTLDVDLTRRIRLRGEANADGGTAAGVAAEWEW